MQVSRTELTLNQAKGITTVPLRFRRDALPKLAHGRIWQEKPTVASGVALRKLKKDDPNRELYRLGGATVAKPICCTEKKEKHKW